MDVGSTCSLDPFFSPFSVKPKAKFMTEMAVPMLVKESRIFRRDPIFDLFDTFTHDRIGQSLIWLHPKNKTQASEEIAFPWCGSCQNQVDTPQAVRIDSPSQV